MRIATWLLAVLLGLTLAGCPSPAWLTTPLPPDEDVPTDGSVTIVSVMVDAEQEETGGLLQMVHELLKRRIPATVYVTADYANRNAALVQEIYGYGFEIGLHGYNTGEQLASMTYDQQKDLILRAKRAVEGCWACGTGKTIKGFRPQYFSQNEDTYKILDELGFAYNSGFKAGHLPFAGLESTRVPVTVPGHQFVAIGFSTIIFEEADIYLCDISCANVQKMSGAKWQEALRAGLQDAQEKKIPLVVNFHGWYTGDRDQYDYWRPFVEFLDEALEAGVVFVRSQNLARLYAQ